MLFIQQKSSNIQAAARERQWNLPARVNSELAMFEENLRRVQRIAAQRKTSLQLPRAKRMFLSLQAFVSSSVLEQQGELQTKGFGEKLSRVCSDLI